MATWDWQVFCKDAADDEIRPSCFGSGAEITYLDWLLSAWGWTLSAAGAVHLAALALAWGDIRRRARKL